MDQLARDIRLVPTPAAMELKAQLDGRDWPAVLAVLDEHWTELWYSVDPTDLRGLLSQAPEELLAGLANAAFLAETTGHVPPRDGDGQMRGGNTDLTDPEEVGKLAVDLRLRGRPAEAMTYVAPMSTSFQAMGGRLVDTSGGRAALLFVQGGCTAMLAGDLPTARAMLQEATTARRPDRFPFVVRDALAKLALAHAVAGNVPEALRWSDRARTLVRSDGWVEALVDDSLWLVDYICAVDSLELERAEELRAARPSPLEHLEFWGIALQAQVRHLVLTHRAAQASTLCDDVAAAGLPREGSDGWVATMLADARLMASDGADPVPTVGDDSSTTAHRALDRCLRAFTTGQFRFVAEYDWTGADKPVPDCRPLLALQLLRGQSMLYSDRAEEGRRLLVRTLDEVIECRLLSLLRYLMAEGLESLGDAAAGAEAAGLLEHHNLATVEVTALLKSPLTPAELEILLLLRRGMSRQQMADQLFVSLNTVKSHLGSAYRKLGVPERTSALAKLAQLGL